MKESKSNGHQITWDGRTVWVNSGKDGSSIGRFSHVGADIHHPVKEQIRTGKQCLACFDDGSTAGWEKFRALMREHYGVQVPDRAIPDDLDVRYEQWR